MLTTAIPLALRIQCLRDSTQRHLYQAPVPLHSPQQDLVRAATNTELRDHGLLAQITAAGLNKTLK